METIERDRDRNFELAHHERLDIVERDLEAGDGGGGVFCVILYFAAPLSLVFRSSPGSKRFL
jgi:hypothetical protein